VLAGIFPVTSHRLALRLHNEVPGIVVPQALQDALESSGASAAEIGMAHARELVAEARERCDGVYVVAPYRRPAAVLELLGWLRGGGGRPASAGPAGAPRPSTPGG